MKLELGYFPVKDVKLGKKISYNNGILQINKDELLSIASSNTLIASAELDIAFPGDQTRIVRVRDIVEPRIKVSGPGCVFPGIMGPVKTVGEGRTHTMPGVSVIVTADYNYEPNLGSGGQNSGIIDMWGPGAPLSPFGNLINIVLTLNLIDGVSEIDAHTAIRLAQYKVAHRLAEATRQLTPENIETFELSDVDPSLPRVVYDLTFESTWHEPQQEVVYYGLPVRESLATFMHPNEIIDGAITTDARRGNGEVPSSWEWMKNPVVLGLLREHGKRVNFLGVVFHRTRYEAEWCKFIGVECASQMARMLKADGTIITKISPSGNNSMDLMFMIESSEERGIKTVFISPEYGGAEGKEPPLLFATPAGDAIISPGSLDRGHQLEKPTKVIGCKKGGMVEPYPDEPIDPWSELYIGRMTFMAGSIDYLGHMKHTCRAY